MKCDQAVYMDLPMVISRIRFEFRDRLHRSSTLLSPPNQVQVRPYTLNTSKLINLTFIYPMHSNGKVF